VTVSLVRDQHSLVVELASDRNVAEVGQLVERDDVPVGPKLR
jgi:hypothetical protein